MRLDEQLNRITEMMEDDNTPYAVIEITKPLSYMSQDYYYQEVPYWKTKKDKIYIKKGPSGYKTISTDNIKVLKVFKDGDTEELQDYLKSLRKKNKLNEVNDDWGTEVDDKRRQSYIKIIDKFMKLKYPGFNKENVGVYENNVGNVLYTKWFEDKKRAFLEDDGKFYARLDMISRELILERTIFEDLEKYFGDFVMTFVIDWFNQEFGENAEAVTF